MDIQTILAIAEKHNNPDAEIQYKSRMPPTIGEWVTEKVKTYAVMIDNASSGYEYRIKPKTIKLNGEELPSMVYNENSEGIALPYTHNGSIYWVDLKGWEFAGHEEAVIWRDSLTKLFNS